MGEPYYLKTLRKVVARMAEILAMKETDVTRDAAIQRFEYTYEHSWKSIVRFLKEKEAVPSEELQSRKDVFRKAWEKGLISHPNVWFAFTNDRNKTTHVYQEKVAEEVYRNLPDFLTEVQFLLKQLEIRQQDEA